MKKVIYQKMYDCFSILSERFDNKLLTKTKVMLGAVLIALTSSCNSDSDEPEMTCYAVYIPKDSVEVKSQSVPDTSIESGEIEADKIQDL